MNQYLKNLLSVTEVLITKDLQQVSEMRINPEHDYLPSFDIFDEDINDVGMSFAAFASTLGELDKKNYIDLELVVGFSDKTNSLPQHTDTISKILHTGKVRKPDARFNVWVKGNIWRLYDAILKEEDIDKIVIGTSIYLPDEFKLVVHDYRVSVKMKSDAPNDHYILKYMVENGFDQVHDFSTMNEQSILGDRKENLRSYYDSCKHLNEKIEKATNGKIVNFLLAHAGDTGSVRVNPKYL